MLYHTKGITRWRPSCFAESVDFLLLFLAISCRKKNQVNLTWFQLLTERVSVNSNEMTFLLQQLAHIVRLDPNIQVYHNLKTIASIKLLNTVSLYLTLGTPSDDKCNN